MRKFAGSVALALAFVAGAFVLDAQAQEETPEWTVENCVLVEEHNKALCDVVFPDPTTTTTVPETTTTTEPPTTTAPPTTTTTEPPSSELVIPETLPFADDVGFKEGESFKFMIGCTDEKDRNDVITFACQPDANGSQQFAVFDYFAHGMPYLYSEAQPGNHDHAWWVAGDREGYRCGYAFMYDKHPNPFGHPEINREGHFIARATIVRPLEAGYGKLNDTYMAEGVRYYDGSPANEGGSEISEDCQQAALDDFDYDAYVPTGPDDIRVGLFRADGEIGDVRDFTIVDVSVDADGDPMGWFEYVGLEDGRVTIVFILAQNLKVAEVFYYDVLNDGRIAAEVDGVVVAEG